MGKFNQKSNCRQRDVSDRYMKIGIFIKNFAVGKQFDKSGVPNKSGAEFHGENHAKLLLEYGDDVYIMTKKTYFFTKGRELINGIMHRLDGWKFSFAYVLHIKIPIVFT